MTVSATYLSDLSRVRVTFSGMSTAADYARVERSVDGITWVTVRGREQVTLSSGAGVLDDYEFIPAVVNTYRVTAVDSAPQSWVGSGGPVTGNNAGVTPFCHASTLIGDLVLLLATIRNSGAGSPDTPAGWTPVVDMGNVKLFGRYATADGSTGQAVTFSGGVANADTTAQMTTFRNTGITPAGAPSTLTNASAQNISFPAGTPSVAGVRAVVLGWKQDDQSSSPAITGWDSEAGYVSSTAGDDASHVWWQRAKTSTFQQPAGTWTVSGGASAISKAAMVFFPPKPFTNQETTTISPTINRVWLKNPARPYMNTAIEKPVGLLEVEREARAGVFPVVGRSLPVAVTDLRLGKEYELGAQVASDVERDRLDAILSAGDVVYLQIPPGGIRLKSMFATIGRSKYEDEAGIQWMPLSQVAAPPVSVAGTTSTWQTVVSTYATCTALLAAKATCADVLDIVGSPTDIITG